MSHKSLGGEENNSSAQNVERALTMTLLCVKVASEEQKVTNRLPVPGARWGEDPSLSYVKDVRVKLQQDQVHTI